MRTVVFGATGPTGRQLTEQALAVITTQVRPSIAGLIWREAVAKKK
ncbi:hypothetical protein [Micromonospora arborensis]